MPVQRRALAIGMIGPVLQALGLVWEVAHVLIVNLHTPMTARHMLFEPGFLLMFVGFLVTLICVPVAIEVAHANEEEVAIPLFGPPEASHASRMEHAD